jgi:transposase-like protein
MPVVSISEAARIAGVARSTLYRQNKQNNLSFTKLQDGQPGIDLAELYRVYPQQCCADANNATAATADTTSTDARKIAELQLELRLVREQLHGSQEREVWFKKQIEDLTGALKQIEHRPQPEPATLSEPPPVPKRVSWFGRLLGKG